MSRSILTIIIALALAVPALAQDAAPARFFIERIEVRNNHRVSANLVKAESLLREGAEYSESELSAAASRLSRLPFLLSADFTLEKGTDRGRHVLVITVAETKPFFFLLNLAPTLWDESRRAVDYDLDPVSESKDGALGFRWFVGGRGIVHVGVDARRDRQALTADYSMVAIGYTQYDLFGTRAFATLNLRVPFESNAEKLISPQIVVGVPLTTRQTLTLDYQDTYLSRDTITILGVDFSHQYSERLISLSWTYNTTNEPFVPTRGTLLRIAPLYTMEDRAGYSHVFVFPPVPEPPIATAQHVNGYGLDAAAMRYWELSERNSVSAGVLAGWSDIDDEVHPQSVRGPLRWRPAYQIVRAGFSHSLWGDASRPGDSRVELDARVITRQRNVSEGKELFGVTPSNEKNFEVAGSWVRRSSWGMLRLGVGYLKGIH
jgi:hypothetical protein